MSKPILLHTFIVFTLLSSITAWAQEAATAPQPQQLLPQETVAEETPAPRMQPHRIHINEGSATIDELRVQGQTQSIDVKPPGNAPAYEVVPHSASQPPGRGNEGGQRRWRVLSF